MSRSTKTGSRSVKSQRWTLGSFVSDYSSSQHTCIFSGFCCRDKDKLGEGKFVGNYHACASGVICDSLVGLDGGWL